MKKIFAGIASEVLTYVEWIVRLLAWRVLYRTVFALAWYMFRKVQGYVLSTGNESLWDAQGDIACAIMAWKEHLLERIRADYEWDYYEWSVRKFTKYYVHDAFVTFIMFLDDEFDNRMIDRMWDLSVPLRNWATK